MSIGLRISNWAFLKSQLNHAMHVSVILLTTLLLMPSCSQPVKDQERLDKTQLKPITPPQESLPSLVDNETAEFFQVEAGKIREHGTDSLVTPESLVGLGILSLKRLLGEPIFIRREPPVELWHFEYAECLLLVFLQESLVTARYEVIHADMLRKAISRRETPKCDVNIILEGSSEGIK